MAKMVEYVTRQLMYNKIDEVRSSLEHIGITVLEDDDIIDFIDGTPIDFNGALIRNTTKLEDIVL